MHLFVPRVLAAGLGGVAIAALIGAAQAIDCGGAASGPPAAGCNAGRAARRAPLPTAEVMTIPAAFPDDTALLDALLAIDLGDMAMVRGLESPGVLVAAPSPASAMPAAGTTAIETWSKLETERRGEDARTLSSIGVGYRPSAAATLKMSLESEEASVDDTLTAATRMTATLGLKPSSIVGFETSAAWAHLNSGQLGSWTAQNAQSELSARINGNLKLGDFKLTPSVTVAHPAEVALTEGASVPKGTIVLSPTISRPIALDHAQALEPFLTVKEQIAISSQALEPAAPLKTETSRSVGGGVKLEERDTYSLSISTDVENLEAEHKSLRSQFRLTVPLR